jgi:predicted dehydrogenase
LTSKPPVTTSDPTASTYAAFANEVRHFIDCIRQGREPTATVGQGLDVLRILDALYRSAASGREILITAR